jgi:hypothetical protein
MAEFATSWIAIAASRRPEILVTSSTPLSVSSRWIARAKRMASQIEIATAAMAPARANPSPTPRMRWTYSIVATIAPGPASSGVPSGTKATFARSTSASEGSVAFPVSSSSATSSRSRPPAPSRAARPTPR